MVAGLCLEFLSVTLALSKLFWSKEKGIEEKGRTEKQITRSNMIEGVFVIILLGLGMLLQGLAVFS
jgi:hypothetical protein